MAQIERKFVGIPQMLTRGRSELIVTATGVRTEIGRLSQELASAAEAPTPLQIQLSIFMPWAMPWTRTRTRTLYEQIL